jgi:hypothetical protein
MMMQTRFARVWIAASISMLASSASAASRCPHNVTEIKFEIYPTRGSAPTCLALRSNGTASFAGQRAGRSGYYEGNIPKSEFDATACGMIKSGFFGLSNEFANRRVQDASTERISAIRNNRSSSVEIYAVDEPDAFHRTAAILKKIIKTTGWKFQRPYSKLADSVRVRFQSIIAVNTNGHDRYGVTMDHDDVYFAGDRDRTDGRIFYASISPKVIGVVIDGKNFEVTASSRSSQCSFQ